MIIGPRFLTRMTREHAPHARILPSRFCNPWLPTYQQTIHEDTICVHEWGHATRDEELWPEMNRQPGAQRYF